MAIKRYRDLDCYKNALLAIPGTSKAPEKFPPSKATRLVEQICAAAHSVTSNIAEEYGHKHNEDDFKRNLRIAMGSCHEVVARLETTMAEGYVEAKIFRDLADRWTNCWQTVEQTDPKLAYLSTTRVFLIECPTSNLQLPTSNESR